MTYNKKQFRNNLLRIHAESNMMQKEAQTLAGVSKDTYQKWISGLQMPSAEGLYRLSIAYGVPMEKFMEGCVEWT